MPPFRFALCVACLAICTVGCASDPPMRSAGSLLFHADTATAVSAADASLICMHYSTYHGNPRMIVGSREDATAAAPFTTVAGMVFFPIGLLAAVALSPITDGTQNLPLAALPIMDSGYKHRLMYVAFASESESNLRVTVTATDARDAAQLWSELIMALGQPLDLGGPDAGNEIGPDTWDGRKGVAAPHLRSSHEPAIPPAPIRNAVQRPPEFSRPAFPPS